MCHVSWNIVYNLTFCLSQYRTSLLAWQQLCWVWERFEGNLFEYSDGHGHFGAGVRVCQGKHIQIVTQTARVHHVAGRDGRYFDLLYFQACCVSAMEKFPVFGILSTATRPAHFVQGQLSWREALTFVPESLCIHTAVLSGAAQESTTATQFEPKP